MARLADLSGPAPFHPPSGGGEGQLEIHWVVWDIPGVSGRPSRLDAAGALVYSHPSGRRGYSAGNPGSQCCRGMSGQSISAVLASGRQFREKEPTVPLRAWCVLCSRGRVLREWQWGQAASLQLRSRGVGLRCLQCCLGGCSAKAFFQPGSPTSAVYLLKDAGVSALMVWHCATALHILGLTVLQGAKGQAVVWHSERTREGAHGRLGRTFLCCAVRR
jgi:hypothetical protein